MFSKAKYIDVILILVNTFNISPYTNVISPHLILNNTKNYDTSLSANRYLLVINLTAARTKSYKEKTQINQAKC